MSISIAYNELSESKRAVTALAVAIADAAGDSPLTSVYRVGKQRLNFQKKIILYSAHEQRT